MPEDDQQVHQNLVRIMDRRLSNVQLQQHLYEEQHRFRQQHRHSNASSGGNSISSPRRSIDRNGQEHRRSILQQPRSSVGARSSNGSSNHENRTGSNADRHYLGYVGQAAHKRRRTTFWETLTGLVCSLGALASRAAKMAARRGDPL